jgi:hypothetical protein
MNQSSWTLQFIWQQACPHLVRQDKFFKIVFIWYEKMSSCSLGQFGYVDIVLTVVKNSLQLGIFEHSSRASLLVSVYVEKFSSQ